MNSTLRDQLQPSLYELGDTITKLIVEFEKKTGFSISEIEIEHESFMVNEGEYCQTLRVNLVIGL